MIRGLSRGLDPVVTGRTSPRRDSDVSKGRAGPCHRAVATVSRHRSREVSHRFSLRNGIVVTLRATPGSHSVMGKERRLPIGRPMATVAIQGRGKMVRRLKGGDDPPSGRVTLHTLSRSPTKHPLDVASLTRNLSMSARELKSGCSMIKFHIGSTALRSNRTSPPAQRQQEKDRSRAAE